jgi:multiple sugar transport system substrate-binding protein
MATIKDVAEKAGVSMSTVSLVINGKRNISKEKYAAITNAMNELHYRPSILAQNLKKQKFHIVGVVFPSNEGHYAEILKAVHDELIAHRYHTIVNFTEDDIQREEHLFEEMISMGVSGIISIPAEPENSEKYKRWTSSGFPIVFLERKINDIDFSNVLFDNQKTVYYKTRELLKKYSPEEIVLITGSRQYSNERDCVTGFIDALKDRFPAFNANDAKVIETSARHYRAMHDILKHLTTRVDIHCCYLVTNSKIAEMLAELTSVMKQAPAIYTLSGNVWQGTKRRNRLVCEVPRETALMGKEAALLLMGFVANERLTENRDILIEARKEESSQDYQKKPEIERDKPLRLLLLESNAMNVLKMLSPHFTKETGIRTEFTFTPFHELSSRLVHAPESLTGYDLLWVDIPLIETVTKIGRLLNLKPLLASDERNILERFPKGVLKCVQNDKGQVYGLPILMDEGVLYYRKDVFSDPKIQWSFFEKYGFELRPPGNWAEFNCVAEFFNPVFNRDSAFKYGTVLALTRPTAVMEEFYVRQWAFGGRMIDKWNRFSIFSIENIRALESLMVSYTHAPPESLDYFFEETFTCLLKGETAMVQGFTTHFLPFRYPEYYHRFEEQIGVAPIPGGRPVLGGWVMGISAVSEMSDEAYEFLTWVTREDLTVIRGLLGYLTPIKATYESTLLSTFHPGLRMMNVENYTHELREVIRNEKGEVLENSSFEQIISEEIIEALTGKISASDALREAHRKVEAVLGKKNNLLA